jgi:hypothetical protein
MFDLNSSLAINLVWILLLCNIAQGGNRFETPYTHEVSSKGIFTVRPLVRTLCSILPLSPLTYVRQIPYSWDLRLLQVEPTLFPLLHLNRIRDLLQKCRHSHQKLTTSAADIFHVTLP